MGQKAEFAGVKDVHIAPTVKINGETIALFVHKLQGSHALALILAALVPKDAVFSDHRFQGPMDYHT
jgi:predicted acetyltransferase